MGVFSVLRKLTHSGEVTVSILFLFPSEKGVCSKRIVFAVCSKRTVFAPLGAILSF